jgi:1,4-dihydroxy-6-naphthoate synthase
LASEARSADLPLPVVTRRYLSSPVKLSPVKITVAHSPDSDDAFMFYGLASGAVRVDGIEVDQVLSDIETLNRCAFDGKYEVTAVSFHAYAHLAEKYALLPHGASMGDRYGPILVALREIEASEGSGGLKGLRIGIPGRLTSAYLALQLFDRDFEPVILPFDEIQQAVVDGRVDAGLLIHEGQLTYAEEGLKKIVDLGEWWADRTGGLPLPLGGNVIKRDLGPTHINALSRLLHDSIAFGLNHRDEAVQYSMQFGRGLDRARTDKFVGMYVNDLTLDYGERGRQAVKRLLGDAEAAGLIPPVRLEFAST